MKNVVIYVGAFELPDRNAAAHRVRANATLLKSLGYEVVLIGRNPDPCLKFGEIRSAKYEGVDFECWELGYPTSKAQWLKYITSNQPVKNLITARYAGRLHSVICYNFPSVAQLRIRNLVRRLGGLGLADVTEWYQTLYSTNINSIIKNFDTSLRMRVLNFRMDGLITTSQFLTRYYERKFNNLVELPTLIEMADEILPFASPENGPKQIFFAGAIEDKRGVGRVVGGLKDRLNWVIELLGEADALGANFCLNVYGVAKVDYLNVIEEHQDLIQRLGEKVRFHGRQPHAIVLERLKVSDFSMFMRPDMVTTNAGFPTKFSESVTYGTPVITNMLDCLEPYMKNKENCIIVSRDDWEGSIKTVVDALSMPPSEVLRMANYCLASKTFSPAAFRQEALKLFPVVRDNTNAP